MEEGGDAHGVFLLNSNAMGESALPLPPLKGKLTSADGLFVASAVFV